MIVKPHIAPEGHLVLTISGRNLDRTTATEFREEAGPAIAANPGRAEVDCTPVDFIDSSGVGALIHTSNLLAETDRPLRLTGVGSNVLSTLELMRVHRLFEIQPRA